MPIHDWTRVDAGLFHHFHQDWTVELCRSLNAGRLPAGYIALVDQQTGGPIPDVLTLNRKPESTGQGDPVGGLAVATAPPQARFVVEAEEDTYGHGPTAFASITGTARWWPSSKSCRLGTRAVGTPYGRSSGRPPI